MVYPSGKKVVELTDVHDISLQEHSIQNPASNKITDYRLCIAIPYIEELMSNINNRFSEASVQLLTSSAVFHPATIPKDEPDVLEYGRREMQNLVAFYGEQASVEFEGVTYTSEALIDAEEPVAEWRIFKKALVMERDVVMEKKKLTKPPTLQELKVEMMAGNTYVIMFPRIFKLLDSLLT